MITTIESISTTIHRAQLFNPSRKGELVNHSDLLLATESFFAKLLDTRVPYLLVGGVAMLSYVEGQNTEDIDLIMDRSSLDDVGLVITDENRNFVRSTYEELQVDILLTHNSLFLQSHAAVSNSSDMG